MPVDRDLATIPLATKPEAAAVLSLPPEIVAEIFRNFLPSYPKCPPCTGLSSPSTLSQICGLWRQIALTTPHLWRAIKIKLEADDSELLMARKLDTLEAWLSRSGACPLSIRLHYTTHDDANPTGQPLLSQFIHAIVRHCDRWQYLDLLMPHETLHAIKGEMPLLKALEIEPSLVPPENEARIELFNDAPRLTDVVLERRFFPKVIHLPWSQLQCIEGQCLYEHECVLILKEASNLVRLTVVEMVCDPWGTHSQRLTHHHLRDLRLSLTVDSDANVDQLLGLLTLPALRTLELSDLTFAYGDLRETVQGLILRSGCALDLLRIDNIQVSEEEYHDAFPSVKTLTLNGKHWRC
ncbi:F-box domain-containing protein [Favolaschia claudopus]|uniref:F-box domain-containing protein n=1 Tax=Favolaschia claudopus TaxID=2862362 RepID=A0AAW0B1M9_9AGAR